MTAARQGAKRYSLVLKPDKRPDDGVLKLTAEC
jgi:hypothetical protein